MQARVHHGRPVSVGPGPSASVGAGPSASAPATIPDSDYAAVAKAALLELGLSIPDTSLFRGCMVCILDVSPVERDGVGVSGGRRDDPGRKSDVPAESLSDGLRTGGAPEALMEGCREAAAAAARSASEAIAYARTALELTVAALGGEVLDRADGLSKGVTHVVLLDGSAAGAAVRRTDGGGAASTGAGAEAREGTWNSGAGDASSPRGFQKKGIPPSALLRALYTACVRGCGGDVGRARRRMAWLRRRLTAGYQRLDGGEQDAGLSSASERPKPIYLVDPRYGSDSVDPRYGSESLLQILGEKIVGQETVTCCCRLHCAAEGPLRA